MVKPEKSLRKGKVHYCLSAACAVINQLCDKLFWKTLLLFLSSNDYTSGNTLSPLYIFFLGETFFRCFFCSHYFVQSLEFKFKLNFLFSNFRCIFNMKHWGLCTVHTELKRGRMLNSEKVLLVLVCEMHFWVKFFLYSLKICCFPFFIKYFAKLGHQGNFN